MAAEADAGSVVAVLGAGTLGLATIAALRSLTPPGNLVVAARYPHQRQLAKQLGADVAVPADELERAVRRRTRSLETSAGLTAGADAVVDCVGSADSLAQALAVVRPRGRVVLAGMPGTISTDLAGLWHREVALVGAYAYGIEHPRSGGSPRTFDLAFDLVRSAGLGRLVSATYPLERFEEAIAHAGSAGRRGAVKIVFDLRNTRRDRWRRAERAQQIATGRVAETGRDAQPAGIEKGQPQ
jgi:threonine dehydrogenase-like Zn-dependent dehydrogenase